LTSFSRDVINLKAGGDSFSSSDATHLIASERAVLIANVLNWSALEDIRIGSEATNHVDFDARDHFLEFLLYAESGDKIRLDASRQQLWTAVNIVGLVGDDVRIAGSTVVGAAKFTNFTANDIRLVSRSEISANDNFFKSNNGQTFTINKDMTIDGRLFTVDAPRISLSSTDSIIYNAGHFADLVSEGTINVLATNAYLSGGNFDATTDGSLFVRPQQAGGKNPDVKFTTFKNAELYSDNYSITTTNDVSYTSAFGDLNINIINDLSLTAVQELNIFTDGGASFLVHGGGIPFTAQRDILIRNGLVDNEDVASFTFGEDIDFEAPVISINSAQRLLSRASGDILLGSASGVESVSQALKVTTLSPNEEQVGGVNIFAKNEIQINSLTGSTTWDSAEDVRVFASDSYHFTTPLLELAGTENVALVGGNNFLLDLLGLLSIASDGYIIETAENSLSVDVTVGPLGFTADDSINSTTISYYDWSADANVEISGGYFTSFSTDISITAQTGSIDFTADTAGLKEGTITLKSHTNTGFSAGGDISVSTGQFYQTAGGSWNIITGKATDLSFTASDSYLELQPVSVTLSGDYDVQAGSYSYSSFEFDAYFDATVRGGLSLHAQESVYITSDGDLTFNLATSPFVARASNLWQAHSYDSSEFFAGTTLSITAPGSKNVQIHSDGLTGFKSRTNDVVISAASYFDVDAGRVVMDAFSSGAKFLATSRGNVDVASSQGSIRLQSDGTIESTNQDSHIFTSTDGVDFTADKGLYFYLEGVLSGGNTAVEFHSSNLYGDIVFDSELSGFTLVTLKSINYQAANNISLASAQGAQFLANTDINWNAPHGSFDVNGAEGISILAGEGVDPADIIFNQLQGAYQVLAGEQIKFHSTGVVEQTAITISAVSDIRFSTGNSGDVTFLADGLLDIFASGSITATGTNNLYVESETDAVTIDAITGADFYTKGGPIRFSTLTNANGGQINLVATGGDIDLTSGNSTTIFARGNINLNAQAGMSFTSIDGSVEVSAESASSYINLLSQGGIQVRSSGSERTPEDGLIFQAANNIAFGTPTTKTIQFNAGNDFVVGDVTRPIISFNAGGTSAVDGFTIDSSGGIYTSSENTFQSDIGGNLEVDTHFIIGSVSHGPTQLTSGKAMFVNADAGIVELSADRFLKVVSSDSLTGTTAGSLDLISVGNGPNDQMLWQAPAVSITTGTHQMMGTVLDADLTHSFTLTTSGTGTLVGGLDSDSHISFVSKTTFTAASDNLLSFITLEDNGPIEFATKGANSNVNLVTDIQSDMEIGSSGNLDVFAATASWSANSISITAIDTVTQSERTDGDIQVGAQSNINAFSQQDMFLAGAREVLIETVGVTAGVGAPLSITATGDINLNADGDFLIANTPGEGGSLAFSALTDILIQNSDSRAFTNVVSDENVQFTATRDYSTVETNEFYTLSGDEQTITSNGKDSNEGFGIKFTTTQATLAEITFQAIFGSIQFSAGTNINVNADGHPGDPGHDLTITSDHNGSFRGKTGTTINTVNDVSITTKQGRILLDSATGIEVDAKTTPLQSTPDLLFQGGGVDDNGDYSIRFREEGGFPMNINVGVDLSIDANEDVSFRAPIISMASDTSIAFESAQADLLFRGQTTDLFAENVAYSARNIVYKTDYFGINAQAGMKYTATNGDLVLETTGLHGNIDLSASAEILLKSTNDNIDIVTARRPNANVRFISSLARIEFQPRSSNFEGFSIDFLAENGDLTFDAQGDDADVYVNVQGVIIEAEAGIDIESTFPADPLIPGVIVASPNTNIIAESDFSISTDSFNLNAPTVSFLSNLNTAGGTDYGDGGSTTLIAEDDIDIAGNTISFTTYSQESLLVVSSELEDITFVSPVIQLSTDAVMQIPYNNNPAPYFNPNNGNNPAVCRDRELFAWDAFFQDPIGGINPALVPNFPFDADNSWLLVCVCVGGAPNCVALPEPPCVPGTPACSGFDFF